MFYTLTLNPSLDLFMHSEHLSLGKTNRSGCESIVYGGKGINVAVMLARLGFGVTALGFSGGFTGEKLLSLVAQEGVRADFVPIGGDTRINVKLSFGGEITEINAKGPTVSAYETELLFSKLATLQKGDTLVLSGSVPPSFSADIYAEIMRKLSPRGVRFAVDTSGDALEGALPLRPFVIKPNLSELEEIVRHSLENDDAIFGAMKEMQKRGAQNILLSLGEKGAMLLDAHGRLYCQSAPKGDAVNTVAAGDSMLAAFLAKEEQGSAKALRYAVAAGSATAFSEGIADRDTVERVATVLLPGELPH